MGPTQTVTLVLNGRTVEAPASTRATLLDYLRSQGLTGAKEGCAEGGCGACTVAMVGNGADGPTWRAINSCLLPLATVAGREIVTVEALAADGGLAAPQQAIAAAGGSQCGYCTPGFVMSLFAAQYARERSGPIEPHVLGGNLCRCTGYRPIVAAARSLPMPGDDAFSHRLRGRAGSLDALRVEGFSRPASVEHCLEILAHDPDAVIIAGATDLGVEANLEGRRFSHLVSLEAIDELHGLTMTPQVVRIGAATPLTEIGHRWTEAPPAVREWLSLFASPPIRNRATLGGNLATASPIGDSAPLLLALDAHVTIVGPQGARTVPLREFFTGYRQTRLQRGELLTTIDIAHPQPQQVRFYKAAKRQTDDISAVAAGMALSLDAFGRVQVARFAFGGVAATPVRLFEAERAIERRPWNAGAVATVQQVIVSTLKPMSDHRGSKEYRLDVAAMLVEKFAAEVGV
jgi:xanthine dehydrogenase small subunit